jgi:hypothetical protein
MDIIRARRDRDTQVRREQVRNFAGSDNTSDPWVLIHRVGELAAT